jgi:hypothetical protein
MVTDIYLKEVKMKLTIEYELPHKTVEEFDKWRDDVDEGRIEVDGDTCDNCPVKAICDLSMAFEHCLEDQHGIAVPLLNCSGVYAMALEMNK